MLLFKKKWKWLCQKLNWVTLFLEDVECHLHSWPNFDNSKVYSKLWNITRSIISWKIWKERNRRIFNDSEMDLPSFLNKIEASIIEVMNNHLRNVVKEEGSFSN